MSKRRNVNNRKARLVRQRMQERSQVKVNPTGQGESGVVGTVLREGPGMSYTSMLEQALMLQRMMLPNDCLLETDPDKVSKLRGRARKMDAAGEAFEADQAGFIQGIFDQVDRTSRPSKDEEDRLRAIGMQKYQEAIVNSKANRAAKQIEIENLIANGPTEVISVAGVMETYRVGNALQTRIRPEVIRIHHKTWTLSPGNHTVPQFVADRYREIMREREHRMQRQKVMGANAEQGKMTRALAKLDQEYGSPSEIATLR